MRLPAVRPSEVQPCGLATDPKFSRLALCGFWWRFCLRSGRPRSARGDQPVTRPSMPRSERERIVPLSVAQVQALTQAMPAPSMAMVITQAGLGLRIAELLGLRVQDVDFLERTESADRVAALARREAPGSTQTPRSRRMLAVAEPGRRVALWQGHKVRRESLADVAGDRALVSRSRLPHRKLQPPR
jgi:integrase